MTSATSGASYDVVAAAIVRDGSVLLARRRHPPRLAGRWELPGGKVEPGESDAGALTRECREELDVEIRVIARIGPQIVTVDGHGALRAYLAEIVDGREPRAIDHDELRWVRADDLGSLDLLEPDRPLVDALRTWSEARRGDTPT